MYGLIKNQKGMSLTSAMVGMAVSLIVVSGFSMVLFQQNRALKRTKNKIELLNLQASVAKALGDTKSCSCLFDMSAPGNPYAAGNVMTVNGGTLAGGIQLQHFSLIGRDPATGNCDYAGRVTEIARRGVKFQPTVAAITGGITVDTIQIRGLQRVSTVNAATTGIAGLTLNYGEFSGVLEITFGGTDEGRNLPPVVAGVSFYVDNATGRGQTCDPAEKIAAFQKEVSDDFMARQAAIDTAFTNTVMNPIQSAVPTVYENVAVPLFNAAISTGRTESELHPSQDDFRQVWADFIAQCVSNGWGCTGAEAYP